MPNWVFNTLKVSGTKEEIDAFVERASQPYGAFGREHASDFLFWNFVRPEDEILPEYFGEEPTLPFEEAIQHKTNHWYDWNIRNWGCKWEPQVTSDRGDDTGVVYYMDTPWSPPIVFFEKLVAMYPTLDFELYYNEEQGWGGEVHGSGGDWTIVDEWDIPDSHEETMRRRNYCYCEENDELDYMYDDCPKRLEKEAVKSGV
jgi:hypothetical protein